VSGNIIYGAIGAVIGYFASGMTPMGAFYGWAIGSAVGSIIDPPEMQGPRLEDLKAQASTYGWAIPRVYGQMRQAGNVIWQPNLIEVGNEDDSKGGAEVTSFSYYAHAAILLCEGPIAGVRRIWANKRLIYDIRSTNFGPIADKSTASAIRVYLGTETQTPDPLIVAHQGDSPAYRGWAYVVVENFALSEHYGNRLPLFEFEIIQLGSTEIPDAQEIGVDAGGRYGFIASDSGELWTSSSEPGQVCRVQVCNTASLAELAQIDQVQTGVDGGIDGRFILEVFNEAWVINASGANADKLMIFNRFTRTFIGSEDINDIGWSTFVESAHFDPTTGHVFAYTGNVHSAVYVTHPLTREVTSSFVPPASTIQGVADIESVSSTFGVGLAVLSGTVSEGGGLHLYPPAIDYTLVPPDFTFSAAQGLPDGFANNGSRLAHDASRAVLVIFANLPNLRQLARIDLFGTLTVVDWEATFGTRYTASRCAVYHAGRDKYYVAGFDDDVSPSLGIRHILELDPVTLLPIRTIVHDDAIITQVCHELLVPKDSNQYLVWIGLSAVSESHAWKFPLEPLLDPAPVFLGDIVRDICTEANMVPASDVNADALNAVPVQGYTLSRQMTARAAMEPLQAAFFFDGVESDDKLKFVLRGGAIATAIAEDDRAAHESGSDKPAGLEITRLQEIESPHTLELRYIDIDRDYEISSAYDRRLIGQSRNQATLDVPVAMTPLKASQVAAVNLYLSWQRGRFAWKTARKYAKYEPTDVVTLQTAEALYNVRIVGKRELPSGLIEWEGALEDGAIYSQNGVESAVSNYPSQTVSIPGVANMALMDIPIMRDDDNDAGFYGAYATAGDGAGCNLYRSTDGTTYALAKQFNAESVIGVTVGALAASNAGNVFDYSQSVNVVLINGVINSDTQINVLNGSNLALIGSELVQFKTATLIGPDTYTLSGLLRGRFGTEWAMSAHAAGERFVLVDVNTWRRVLGDVSQIGLNRFYKAPLFGASLSSASAQSFVNTAVGLTPYAGVQLRGARAGDDLTITWKRRTRLGGGWRDLVDASLGELAESYEVEIWDATFVTLKRTIAAATPSVLYTGAQQTTDFGAPQAIVYARAYQLSNVIGRGYKLEGSI
jgi:hypothetical protein